MTVTSKRHRWGDKVAFTYKSERECLNGCGIVKVTRHEGERHWVEFFRVGELEKIQTDRTPACEPVEVPA